MAAGSFRNPSGGGGGGEDWVRPSDWLAMPTVTSAEQKFVGLHAIHPNGNNFAAFRFTTSTGQYSVDWGDGTTDLVNSNVNAEHEYDYATYDTGNTTLSTRGYKQAIITVTPVSGNLLTCNFQQRYTGQNQAYATGFLDCIISMPNHSASAFTFGGTTVRHAYVERFDVKTLGACNSLANMFQNCYVLQKLNYALTSNVTSIQFIFLDAWSFNDDVTNWNTSSVTTMAQAFQRAYRFNQNLNSWNVSSVTGTTAFAGFTNMFSSAFLFNNGGVSLNWGNNNNVSLFAIFLNTALKITPILNFPNSTNMSGMYQNCVLLQSITSNSTTAITTTAGTDYGVNFARDCSSLSRCEMIFARTVGFANCQLSATALNEIFTNLVNRSATTSATITITGNYGAATANTAIATAKNWTVTN